jgi:hypothetical protein
VTDAQKQALSIVIRTLDCALEHAPPQTRALLTEVAQPQIKILTAPEAKAE